ncbi:Tripartite ATP-independent periplasmic transporter, DctQ component [Psychromonas ingrahamii 37]|uniref:TRAP transporter small permease protein n=1 Tax=Psychromonas ingrahamii (strain DSM 17664 / CCUG 51855 / 37) TaxID=357804 RepID=A1T0G3_PSYIN|nr:TRAP transporter small permease [Psychromonas ingrahamii]ABM05228.1 Tripartite ATP-independent periplasmic transporter, DctQ component [Psychromonas ingrahamii 37]
MRFFLNKLYHGAGILSAVCIVAICVVILARVVGRWMGIVVPSSDDFAGFLLAASSFMALAYTFQHGGHIRVSLFTSRLGEKSALFCERFVLLSASVLSAYLAYELCYMVWESWDYEEVSSGFVAIPMWIVQLPVAIGMVIFAISVIDLTVCSLLFGKRIPLSEEESLAEKDFINIDGVKHQDSKGESQ